MELRTNIVVFAAIIIFVNNFVLYYAIQNKGLHSRIRSVGLQVFLISVVEIVAIGIWSYIHLGK